MHNAKLLQDEIHFRHDVSSAHTTATYERIPCGRHTIFLDPETPFWFVPNAGAARLLSIEEAVRDRDAASSDGLEAVRALDRQALERMIAVPPVEPYVGRKHRRPERLSELWFHLTDACNCNCRHCLFGGRGGPNRSLSRERIETLVDEAYDLGGRLVCFTGGEPFVYPDFVGLLESMLSRDDLRVATLTNAMLLPERLDRLASLDRNRLHFQVSLDGPEVFHDAIRGEGSFAKTAAALREMTESGLPCSVAMAVNSENVDYMAETVATAHDLGVETIHFMWHFRRGSGKTLSAVPDRLLMKNLRAAIAAARRFGVTIDNLEAMKAQLFSHPGTRFDFGNAGWESLAVGPDESVYPTPAMVDLTPFKAGNARDGLERVWRESPVLARVRSASLTEVDGMRDDPWRLIIGGGDLDHCAHVDDAAPGAIRFSDDPYRGVYRFIALTLIEEALVGLPVPEHPGLILRMGDITTDCPSGDDVNFTHCNCLLSMGEGGAAGLVREFYTDRAESPDELILNPVQLPEDEADFIPDEARARMYGCGSPVADAELKPGETLVDLGSGTGVECFLAAREVGPTGAAVGVDMTDAMLEIAERSKGHVAAELGYANVQFRKGFLEELPVENDFADAIISNCVVNLSHNKRRVFAEIYRALKPGGRLVISDVVCESEPPLDVRADHQLIGECIGGALVQDYLFGLLRDVGFVNASVVKRFPYRDVQGRQFYSLTFRAYKPSRARETDIVYAGPFRAVITDDGRVISKGLRDRVDPGPGWDEDSLARAGILTVDGRAGEITNIDAESGCACFIPPTPSTATVEDAAHETGCLICGEPLVYGSLNVEASCAVCGKADYTRAQCARGHFVCDACHIREPKEIARRLCLDSDEPDAFQLFYRVASHPVIPLHGPEYHSIVPGVILAAYRNAGGSITDDKIVEGIERGSLVPGGSCAFMGVCGAATGVGIAYGIMLESNPLKPVPRQHAQRIVARTLDRITSLKAARCCRREAHFALETAARESTDLLPVPLTAHAWESCDRSELNDECVRRSCPFYRRTND